MTDTTVTTEPPQGNQPEARTPDGTLKDQSPTTTPTPSPTETEDGGSSFLTQKPEGKKDDVGDTDPTKTGKEGEGADKKDGDTPQGAPEKYEPFTLPDGYKLDEKTSGEITEPFKTLNLPQEGAQKLVDYYAKNLLQAVEAPQKAWVDLQKEWRDDIAERLGSRADTVRRDINSAITNALPPSLARSFRTALDITGAGTNPDIIEALSIMLKPHQEGKPVAAGRPNGAAAELPKPAPSLAEAMYPHLAQNRGQ